MTVLTPDYEFRVLSSVASRIESSGGVLESDDFSSEMARCMKMAQKKKRKDDITPVTQDDDWIVQTFDLVDGAPMALRVYPRHNDVALRIWEANCYMIERLFSVRMLSERSVRTKKREAKLSGECYRSCS